LDEAAGRLTADALMLAVFGTLGRNNGG